MSSWLEYVIALVIALHGLAYIPFGIVVPHSLDKSYGQGSVHVLGAVQTTPIRYTLSLS
jgi:hypothetical protein